MRDFKDCFSGCLLGCAVGDALGAPFEGLWPQQIPRPDILLSGFAEVEGYPRGQFTDDTQLTLATVESIVERGGVDLTEIAASIANLWRTQRVIGPGGACSHAALHFLKHRDWQSSGAPVGQAGNGTAMRTAAVGLYFVSNPESLPGICSQISQITHRDPRSVAGGVAIAKASQLLVTSPGLEAAAFCEQTALAAAEFDAALADLVRQLPELCRQSDETALEKIAWAGMHKPEFKQPIITPFVVPTVLASLWVVLRFPDSWPRAVSAAIGLGGDVDTLGAIVGALMGAKLGAGSIPVHLAGTVVDSERIRALAMQYHALVQRSSTQVTT